MVNVSPVGRNASSQERNDYEAYDKEHKIREKFIAEIHKKFPDIGLTYSIGTSQGYITDDRWTNLLRLFSYRVG
jgi:hypothetical protein